MLLSVGLIPENELSRQAGAAIDPRTSGPVVFEDRMTSLPGVFACGNVAHVHDLVTSSPGKASWRAGRPPLISGKGARTPALIWR